MTLPVRDVHRPACLAGQTNGKLPDAVLVDVPGQDGGPTVRLVPPAARAWVALCAAAKAAGHVLQATSAADSFRPYAVQEAIFRQRYSTTRIAGAKSRVWNGRTYWQKPGTAAAAVPGTSNHGWALAVDTRTPAGGMGGKALDWLLAHADAYGFSWELQSEPWHIRYYAGDNPPAAVTAHPAPTPTASAAPHQEETMVIPSWAKLNNGHWPGFRLSSTSAKDGITILGYPGVGFSPGLDKIKAPKFAYGSAFGIPTLTITGAPADAAAVAEAPNGDVVVFLVNGDTYSLATKP